MLMDQTNFCTLITQEESHNAWHMFYQKLIQFEIVLWVFLIFIKNIFFYCYKFLKSNRKINDWNYYHCWFLFCGYLESFHFQSNNLSFFTVIQEKTFALKSNDILFHYFSEISYYFDKISQIELLLRIRLRKWVILLFQTAPTIIVVHLKFLSLHEFFKHANQVIIVWCLLEL